MAQIFMWRRRHARTTIARFVPLLSLVIGLAACTAATPAPATPLPVQPTAVATAMANPTATAAAVPVADPAPPVRLHFAPLDVTIAVEPMAWIVTEVEGERQAVWEIPQQSAGWHLNSALVGATGNMIISGHHLEGAAVFAPLARGELMIGDQILVTDELGRIYLYQVSEVADPIPATGATAAETERADTYLAPTTTAQLTLVTGWPDFSDTHYLFVVALLVGPVQP